MSRSRKKQPYRQSRAFDPTCRNHGSCPWCADGRQHKHARRAHELSSYDGLVETKLEARVEAAVEAFYRERAAAAPPDDKTEAPSRTPEQNG